MKIEVSTHKLFGYRATLHTAKQLATPAVKLVNRSVPGSMPDVQITLTNPRGMAELATLAEVELAGGGVDRRVRDREERHAAREGRATAGRAVPLADGSVLVLINVDQNESPGDFAITLVHELVHAMQFSRKGVRERIIRDRRDCFKAERQSRRQARENERCHDEEEREAYSCEYLADQIVPGARAA
ncbi:hypothetical protein OHB33_29120 [Streptomyces sp. NBC_01558]|uniref:hypothetical protein n=1 Tax=Streptomyces sp. NBC_01558 TaxID=2975878 RepID=UPI002DDB729F|nr:hypothetical protein [Streptomyces sp. NBC_01558]WSD80040.1 hypothetical protein OHB33_29120 [Streptomyces sp. NBC_01558]